MRSSSTWRARFERRYCQMSSEKIVLDELKIDASDATSELSAVAIRTPRRPVGRRRRMSSGYAMSVQPPRTPHTRSHTSGSTQATSLVKSTRAIIPAPPNDRFAHTHTLT